MGETDTPLCKAPGEDAPAEPGRSRALPPAAQRALEEAAQRRKAASPKAAPEEIGGRGGEDPARYGDWEVKGIASDF
ncbi:DUF1674 domain-containing protein [Methylocystis heyeri]|uniref:DUF1674 domain-containing protein n=1 Tax=Methylocystis heyeri TaxID=391905 RepID=A0A6B8KL43_9HYPH|nr:DUF1674 domain-containing protein [Methylocystis heyeri]QGM47490.1 DUF1674 domain-containing protein [Methylocystis heyeri]